MDRRLTLLVGVVLLAGLSGCSVILGADDPPATPTPTDDTGATVDPTQTPTVPPVQTPTATSTGTQTATPTPSPAEESVEFDAASLNADHVAALEAAGSFTRQSSLVIRNESVTRTINGSYAVERGGPASSVANVTTVVDGAVEDVPKTTRYTEGSTTYEKRIERTDDGTETRYRRGEEPYNESEPQPVNATVAYTLNQIAYDVVDSSEWKRVGTGRLNGANVTRYDTGGEQFGVSIAPGADGAATMAVSEDDIVLYIAYRFEIGTGTDRTEYAYQAAYSDVGSTTVEEPVWTDQT